MAKKKVTDEEIKKCNIFCEHDYPRFIDDKEYKKANAKRRKYVTNTLHLPYTKNEIKLEYEKLKERIPIKCKKTYCNPKCDGKKPIRYVSNNSLKFFKNFQKRGAITSCWRTDQYAKFVKKLKPITLKKRV